MFLDDRKEVARFLLSIGTDEFDQSPETIFDESEYPIKASLMADLNLPFPNGLRPRPIPINPAPDAEAPLPEADILVITWTVAENDGLADVLTPGVGRQRWYRYRRRFDEHYDALIREGAPAKGNRRLGSYYLTQVGEKRVLCFKSELHLNQDGINLNEDGSIATAKTGYATLPVKDLFIQLINEVKPELVITTGTSGAVFREHDLGSVIITRGAKFRLSDEFENELFNHKKNKNLPIYKSEWEVPTTHFAKATEMMTLFRNRLVEPRFAPPTKRYHEEHFPAGTVTMWENNPRIHLDGEDGEEAFPLYHPILTTDFFEYGTSDNNLEAEGSAVEMGDAVLGLVCQEMENPPNWLVIRNVSDPQINDALPVEPRNLNMQTHFAVWYYEKYGYWTSVTGALANWAVIAGL